MGIRSTDHLFERLSSLCLFLLLVLEFLLYLLFMLYNNAFDMLF